MEKHPFYRDVIQVALSENGYEVVCLSDGQAVQRCAEKELPDLILLDQKSSELTGSEVCRRLKSNQHTKDIPVIILSLSNDEDVRLEAFQSGAADHLSKPFVKEELLARIQVHVNQQKLYHLMMNENLRLLKEIERRKTAEELLIRSERFSAVGVLVQGVAHEFNNISGALKGYSELALMRYGGVDPELKNLLERIQSSADRQIKVVSKIMSVSGKDNTEKSQTLPSSIAKDALELCAFKLKGLGVEVINDLEDPWDILVDSHQMTQVILNLLVNACDAMINVESPKLQIRGKALNNSFYVYSIEDCGKGMPPEHLEKLFQPFFSTKGEFAEEDSPEKQLKGNGLGLSISHRIVQRHGGRFEIDSEEGRGTEFRLILPRTALENSDGQLERVSWDGSSDETEGSAEEKREDDVLIVEDTEESALILQKKLELEKIPYRLVTNGKRAMDAVLEKEPKIIFLDMCMPVMDGETFLEHLSRMGIKVPVVVMSAMLLDEKREKLKELGCTELWNKPIDLQLFGARAKNALRTSRG